MLLKGGWPMWVARYRVVITVVVAFVDRPPPTTNTLEHGWLWPHGFDTDKRPCCLWLMQEHVDHNAWRWLWRQNFGKRMFSRLWFEDCLIPVSLFGVSCMSNLAVTVAVCWRTTLHPKHTSAQLTSAFVSWGWCRNMLAPMSGEREILYTFNTEHDFPNYGLHHCATKHQCHGRRRLLDVARNWSQLILVVSNLIYGWLLMRPIQAQ